MIYKHMYCGYVGEGKITLAKDARVIVSAAAYFEDMVFLYFESTDPSLSASDISCGKMIPFPNGDEWFEMTEIFHYFTPEKDSEWVRKVKNKTPVLRINKLQKDKIASYIYYHVDHQLGNPYDCDKFMSIFLYGNIIVMYSETPTENVLWQDIEGRAHTPPRDDWDDLMNEHFSPWKDGTQRWIPLKTD